MILDRGEEVGLLVADVPWNVFHAALEATSGERFDIGRAVADPHTWDQEYPAQHVVTLLAGEYRGRSYVFSDSAGSAPVHADRVVALAAATGGLVLGHTYFDTTGTGDGVAARGAHVLRYVVEGWTDDHVEGDLLPGETDEYTIAASEGFARVLAAFGFDQDGWFASGTRVEVTWTSLDPAAHPEAFARLYRGPVRMRSMWVEEAALAELEADDDAEGPDLAEFGDDGGPAPPR